MSTLHKIITSKKALILFNSLLIVVFAAFSLLPAFSQGYFNCSTDGFFHLNRFENVILALQNHHIPSMFNYLVAPSYFSYPGVAISAMYPWIGGFTFIIPRLFISDPYTGLIWGFFLLNLLTIVNTFSLLKSLTNNYWMIWFGTIIYEFNNFHFIDLYTRVAIGECFGYAWMPLVILGLIQIHRGQKKGIFVLGLSMGMLGNSHLLSLMMAICFIIIYEINKVIKKEINLEIIKSLVFASLVALAISAYSLFNILLMYKRATPFITPFLGVTGSNVNDYISQLFTNSMGENLPWSYGIAVVLIQLVLTCLLFTKKVQNSACKSWIISADILFVLTFNIFPWEILKNTPLGLIQFLGRLNAFIVLFIVIAVALYPMQRLTISPKLIITFISLVIIALTFNGSSHVTQIKPSWSNHRDKITQENYKEIVTTRYSFGDYIPKGVLKENLQIKNPKDSRFAITNRTENSIQFLVINDSDANITLPTVLYNHFNYQITDNGKNIKSINNKMVCLNLKKGQHVINVQSDESSHKLLFITSTLSILLTTLVALIKRK
ncbi:hypothetical protein [Fructobacillus durionis]|uniref:Membrane protein YfhO n=1 Tax=Fructobacillus durionis TaxID=283737 RepID=A0A1I1E2S6_9LACO|nr:hypothetical protein [Fructobacillus durionis]SFB81481.1 hypothetical protein SAMN05660453_0266 [Fructobacillus durionis]